jgi:hypothetical protein
VALFKFNQEVIMIKKHTPGPWQLNKTKTGVNAGSIRIRQQSPPMAASCAVQQRHQEELLANALIIKAAPDLVDALIRTLRYVRKIPAYDDSHGVPKAVAICAIAEGLSAAGITDISTIE